MEPGLWGQAHSYLLPILNRHPPDGKAFPSPGEGMGESPKLFHCLPYYCSLHISLLPQNPPQRFPCALRALTGGYPTMARILGPSPSFPVAQEMGETHLRTQ